MRKSKIMLSVVALGLPVLALSACGSSSGIATSSMPAPTTSTSSSSAPTSGASSSTVYSEAFCAAFAPLLDLPDPTGPSDPNLDKALVILEAAKADGDETAASHIDAVAAVYQGVKDGTLTIPIKGDEPLVTAGTVAIEQIVTGCKLLPTG